MRDIRFLTLGEVITILQDQISRYGGEYGIRDAGLLSSALAIPQASFGGTRPYEDLFDIAAAYAYHICQNQPFIDGNKRVGLVSALAFLDLNGIEIIDTRGSLYQLTMRVAQGKVDKIKIAAALRTLKNE